MGTKIEWANRPGTTGEVQNFVTGCTRVSDGCTHCYIERQTPMRVAGRRFDGPEIGANLPLLVHRHKIDAPLHWRKPRTVFVNSMSDWMHKDIPRDVLLDAMAVWAVTPQHTYLTLTKRHDRMRAFLSDPATEDAVLDRIGARWAPPCGDDVEWPLPNLWVGVSVENQKWAGPRLDALMDTPAAVRWVSAEPLLGPVDLELLHYFDAKCGGCSGLVSPAHTPECGVEPGRHWGIDWVVVGGESGPGARPMHPDWVRSIRDQCTAAGVPLYVKQWGDWGPAEWKPAKDPDETVAEWQKRCDQTAATHAYAVDADQYEWFTQELHPAWGAERDPEPPGARWAPIRRWGKARAGAMLDGRLWEEYPREAVTT